MKIDALKSHPIFQGIERRYPLSRLGTERKECEKYEIEFSFLSRHCLAHQDF